MESTPIMLFQSWYAEELAISQVLIPSACCLSTIGLDGFPNARFLSLKEVREGKFIITGPLDSRKGLEIDKCLKVALSFWWEGTGRQVRVQGTVKKISAKEADRYFFERNKESQVVATVSRQGMLLEDIEELEQKYHEPLEINRPAQWGGVAIDPIRMEFSASRFHRRVWYEKLGEEWKSSRLQP
jgi:pyridoxamine 5'-phosphate oxidase